MKKVKIFAFVMSFFLITVNAVASTGTLKNASIKTCDGITYGSHKDHWHVASYKSGRYYATGKAIYSDPCEHKTSKQTNTPSVKSSNNKISKIIIDEEEFTDIDDIEFITTNESVNIEVETNDKKAKYIVENNKSLKIGDNEIIIKVTAENGNVKKYNINITREKILSSETGINVYINNKLIEFDNYKARYDILDKEENISFSYELMDKNANVNIDKPKTLKNGRNNIKITVTAEDGTNQHYVIEVYKDSSSDGSIGNIIFYGALGYGGYYMYKKKKKTKENKQI